MCMFIYLQPDVLMGVYKIIQQTWLDEGMDTGIKWRGMGDGYQEAWKSNSTRRNWRSTRNQDESDAGGKKKWGWG